ncbi:MAG: hypothetical protein WDM78_10435 [Puia sp.]
MGVRIVDFIYAGVDLIAAIRFKSALVSIFKRSKFFCSTISLLIRTAAHAYYGSTRFEP